MKRIFQIRIWNYAAALCCKQGCPSRCAGQGKHIVERRMTSRWNDVCFTHFYPSSNCKKHDENLAFLRKCKKNKKDSMTMTEKGGIFHSVK